MPDVGKRESIRLVLPSSSVRDGRLPQSDADQAVFRVNRMLNEAQYIRSGSHHHTFYEVFYYLEGHATIFIQGKVYNVQAGDLVLIAPYYVHSTVYHGDTPVARLGLWFNEAFMGRAIYRVLESAGVLQKFTGDARVFHAGSEKKRVVELFEQMLEESEREGADSQIMRRAILVTFLVCLHRIGLDADSHDRPEPRATRSIVGAVAEYLSERYADEITLPFLSERFGTTPTSLARSFKRETQCTVIEYLQYLRITAAARLLRADEREAPPIAEIASKVGFNNHRHFARVFGKIMGVSPREYRKNYVRALREGLARRDS